MEKPVATYYSVKLVWMTGNVLWTDKFLSKAEALKEFELAKKNPAVAKVVLNTFSVTKRPIKKWKRKCPKTIVK